MKGLFIDKNYLFKRKKESIKTSIINKASEMEFDFGKLSDWIVFIELDDGFGIDDLGNMLFQTYYQDGEIIIEESFGQEYNFLDIFKGIKMLYPEIDINGKIVMGDYYHHRTFGFVSLSNSLEIIGDYYPICNKKEPDRSLHQFAWFVYLYFDESGQEFSFFEDIDDAVNYFEQKNIYDLFEKIQGEIKC